MTDSTAQSSLPHTATLTELPGLLGMDQSHVYALRQALPRRTLPNTRFKDGHWPSTQVYDVAGSHAVLSTTPTPAVTPDPPSPFVEAERLRRWEMIKQALFERHGIWLGTPKTGDDRHLTIEISTRLPVWPGADPTLFVTHVDIWPENAAAAAVSRGDFDDAILDQAIAHLADRARAANEVVGRELDVAVSDWRSDFLLELDGMDETTRAAVLAGVVEKSPPAIALGSAERKMDRIGLSAQHQLTRIHSIVANNFKLAEASRLFQQKVGYDRYPSLFPVARAIERRVVFLAGPTNSGKTHEAMRLASEAKTAEILSPLRLLALEHRDRLAAAGLPAGLVTGEEQDVPAGATHIARTIETIDLNRRVDVAVIDEIQMLGDDSRGWAWTQALVGAPADLVVLTGSPDAIPLVERVVSTLGEQLEVQTFERKTPLAVVDTPVSSRRLRPGDALVAFSRRDVHDFRTLARKAGFTVATVYGALGPEVRRAEAARFRSGEAQVLIATDAIGMGLNLPIQRVIFTTTEKFDGTRMRRLTASEILQIAGRAGRFGHFEHGEVAILESNGSETSLNRIRSAIANGPLPLEGKAYVRPNLASVQEASKLLNTKKLAPILRHLGQSLVRNHPDLRIADLTDDIQKAEELDSINLPLDIRYGYSTAPVSLRSTQAVQMMVVWAFRHLRDGEVSAYTPMIDRDLERMEAGAHLATVWLWLSRKFPDVYPDRQPVVDALRSVNEAIENHLAKSSGQRIQKTARLDEPEDQPPQFR